MGRKDRELERLDTEWANECGRHQVTKEHAMDLLGELKELGELFRKVEKERDELRRQVRDIRVAFEKLREAVHPLTVTHFDGTKAYDVFGNLLKGAERC